MDTRSFMVGSSRCMAIHDGDLTYEAQQYVVNAPAREVEGALARHGHPSDAIPSPYSGLLIETGSNVILIDTGGGALTPTVGRLHANLAAAGRSAGDIDTVVLTHGHPDHIGGNVDASGQVLFPNAKFVMFRAEWEQWTRESSLQRFPEIFGVWARRHLLPLRDRITLLEHDAEIVPGLEAVEAPGHTAGHMAVVLHSAGQQLIYVSDAAIHPIHLENPDWYPVWDLAPDQALSTRRTLFDRAATEDALVLAFHFPPFPSLGRVTRQGIGWAWETEIQRP